MWTLPLLTYRTSEPVIEPPRTPPFAGLASCIVSPEWPAVYRAARSPCQGAARLAGCSENVRTRRRTLSTMAKAKAALTACATRASPQATHRGASASCSTRHLKKLCGYMDDRATVVDRHRPQRPAGGQGTKAGHKGC